MTRNPFVGTWRLVSYEFRIEDGQVIYPLGQDAVGYLIYTEDGCMSVHVMSANRSKFASEDLAKVSKEEKLAVADSCIAYCGKYEIIANKIIHNTEVSTIPNWVGVGQERTFQITGDRLSLSASTFRWNDMQATSHLVWERIRTHVTQICLENRFCRSDASRHFRNFHDKPVPT